MGQSDARDVLEKPCYTQKLSFPAGDQGFFTISFMMQRFWKADSEKIRGSLERWITIYSQIIKIPFHQIKHDSGCGCGCWYDSEEWWVERWFGVLVQLNISSLPREGTNLITHQNANINSSGGIKLEQTYENMNQIFIALELCLCKIKAKALTLR